MRLLIIALLLIMAASAFAEDSCRNQVKGLVREVPLEVKPTYFIRVDTTQKKIYMSGDCTLSLETGKCLTKGRTWEPYPIVGANLVTIPHCGNDRSMCFYKSSDYVNQNDSKPSYIDSEMSGYYQSLGFIEKLKDAKKSKVRVITYYGFMRDYEISGEAVKPASPVKKFCENIDLKLPMLSKDGTKIAGWNVKSESSVIYNLANDGTCTKNYELNMMAGKMDFSYDGKYTAFHANSTQKGTGANVLSIQQSIFILDLKTKSLNKISFGSDMVYYPHFGSDGHIYALKFNKDADSYSLLEIDPEKALHQSGTEAGTCIDCSAADQVRLLNLKCIQ
ncbi:hypothetical protein [Bdellovibrio bacteriovorus]|uniref:Putative exported protein n=1 Tax=Bdellovibrio bacteriovorus str. Tiberius TaxID=1069642 RepID=K7Z8L4_BDEBC|nr:hypothetical protein [Bdellovibrio bacteriovorus]AFY00789.1 putative exported protein [Bdellovibrio bacteriovorus str. Tiberius]